MYYFIFGSKFRKLGGNRGTERLHVVVPAICRIHREAEKITYRL